MLSLRNGNDKTGPFLDFLKSWDKNGKFNLEKVLKYLKYAVCLSYFRQHAAEQIAPTKV